MKQKIKSVDPFFRGRKTGLHLKSEPERDLPPNLKIGKTVGTVEKAKKYKKVVEDHKNQGTKSFQEMMESINKMQNPTKKKKKKKKADQNKFVSGDASEENMKRFDDIKPGESIESYSIRIDTDTKSRLKELPVRQISARRKEKVKSFMKSKKEKAKKKKLQKLQHVKKSKGNGTFSNSESESAFSDQSEDEQLPPTHKHSNNKRDFDDLKDNVEFGEVVHCPPTLTSVPKQKLKTQTNETTPTQKAIIPDGVKEKFFGSQKSESELARERSLELLRLRVREHYKQNKKKKLESGDAFRL